MVPKTEKIFIRSAWLPSKASSGMLTEEFEIQGPTLFFGNPDIPFHGRLFQKNKPGIIENHKEPVLLRTNILRM